MGGKNVVVDSDYESKKLVAVDVEKDGGEGGG